MPAPRTRTISAVWHGLVPTDEAARSLLHRSSHSLAILDSKAYIFGGELRPRTPIGDQLIVLDLESSATASTGTTILSRPPSLPWPRPRVGASMLAHNSSLYLWGGRGGKEMSPLAYNHEPTSPDQEDLWRFDVRTQKWDCLATKGERPEMRSFHTMCAAGEAVYVHAGCPAQGRLNTLHALDLENNTWTQLPSAPGPARGGTVLAAIQGPSGTEASSSSSSSASTQLVRWGGFCGHELGGPLDIYDPHSQTWTSHAAPIEGSTSSEEPPKRSVHALLPLHVPLEGAEKRKREREILIEGKEPVAIMLMGEGEGAPKELGHDGAGKFLSDIYLLLRTPSSEPSYSWLPISATPSSSSSSSSSSSGALPRPRGWFAASISAAPAAPAGAAPARAGGAKFRVIVQGGLEESNERLGDVWVLELEL